MDELRNLEEVLISARKIGEKFYVERDLLSKENAKLREENQRLLAERSNLLVEMNNLLAENERLRKVNATFEKNLAQLPQQFQFIMQNEFRKFLKAASSTNGENFDEEKNFVAPVENEMGTFDGEKKIVVPVENETEILDAEENLPANLNQPKKKMVYAEFFAEEVGFKEN